MKDFLMAMWMETMCWLTTTLTNFQMRIPTQTIHGGVFKDGLGAVLVNILTSMRHLPPGMHSVLVVMALTWVC